MSAIFLSASIPVAERGNYYETANPFLIQAAVREFVTAALGRRLIVWGGHPAITPMVWAVCEDLGLEFAKSVVLYQSRFYQEVFPEENKRFGNVVYVDATPGDQEASLLRMREAMLSRKDLDAAVFVGGMEGILVEYDLFAKFHPNAKVLTVAAPGGAARQLAQKLGRASTADLKNVDFARFFHVELRRSLPDYIFKGRRKNQYYIVECKGTQSSKSATIGQLQRGSEQVVTIGIEPPAKVTRLVIASWLKEGIAIFVIDPDSKRESQTLSRWSIDEISAFAHAKQLSYVGDHRGAATLLKGMIEPTPDLVLEERELDFRQTKFGIFLGTEESITMPDRRLIRMFRGIQADFYRGILSANREKIHLLASPHARGKHAFSSEVLIGTQNRVVRSFARDGSLFEVEIR